MSRGVSAFKGLFLFVIVMSRAVVQIACIFMLMNFSLNDSIVFAG